jgi:hypothetical protein
VPWHLLARVAARRDPNVPAQGPTGVPTEKTKATDQVNDSPMTVGLAAEPNPRTLSDMLARYGPLMEFRDLAAAFKRQSDRAIRVALSRPNPPRWAKELKKARVRHGRRVFFRTRDVALLIERAVPLADDD